MDEDEGFLTSDAELDSEVEDNDESELSVWLDQLNAIQQVSTVSIQWFWHNIFKYPVYTALMDWECYP